MGSRDGSLAVVRVEGLRPFAAPGGAAGGGASISLLTPLRTDDGSAERLLADKVHAVLEAGDWFLWHCGHTPSNRLQSRFLRDEIEAELPHARAGVSRQHDGRVAWVRRLKRGYTSALFKDFEPHWPWFVLVRADSADESHVAGVFDDLSPEPVAAVGRGWWLAATESDSCTWRAFTFFVPAGDADYVEARLVQQGATPLADDDVATFLNA